MLIYGPGRGTCAVGTRKFCASYLTNRELEWRDFLDHLIEAPLKLNNVFLPCVVLLLLDVEPDCQAAAEIAAAALKIKLKQCDPPTASLH